MSIYALEIIVGALTLGVITAPFFIGRGGRLASSSSVESPEKLESIREAVLKAWIKEEQAFKSGDINGHAWQRRQSFLESKYIDASKRLDYLQQLDRLQGEEAENG